ncbi:MAG: hypothetical protein WC197_08425 [Candidatus Gastranaerophilaceae bacterium]|jgi:hypothetical protein
MNVNKTNQLSQYQMSMKPSQTSIQTPNPLSSIFSPQQPGSTTVNPVSPVNRGLGDPSFQSAVAKFSQNNNPFASSGSSQPPAFQGALNNANGALGDQAINTANGGKIGQKLCINA